MKKTIIIVAALLMSLAGCRKKENEPQGSKKEPEQNESSTASNEQSPSGNGSISEISDFSHSLTPKHTAEPDMSTWTSGSEFWWYEDGWNAKDATLACFEEGLKHRKYACLLFIVGGDNEIGVELKWEDWEDKK